MEQRLFDLKYHQLRSLKNVLPRALEYHFSNFQRLEALAKPSSIRDGQKMAEAVPHFVAMTNIKFEVQAYICQLRRIKFFLLSVGLQEPTELALAEIWHAVVDKDGMISMLANKWAAHRSYDAPQGEDDQLHAEVLLNLDGGVTMWNGDHLVLDLKSHELELCSFHPKVLAFVTWMFQESDALLGIRG